MIITPSANVTRSRFFWRFMRPFSLSSVTSKSFNVSVEKPYEFKSVDLCIARLNGGDVEVESGGIEIETGTLEIAGYGAITGKPGRRTCCEPLLTVKKP